MKRVKRGLLRSIRRCFDVYGYSFFWLRCRAGDAWMGWRDGSFCDLKNFETIGDGMKWLIALILAMISTPVFALEWQYSVTGLVPDKFYDVHIECRAFSQPEYFNFNTNLETRQNLYITAVPQSFYFKARSDSAGNVYVTIDTASNKVLAVTLIEAAPYVPPDSEMYTKIVSLFIGAMTGAAFVMASSSLTGGYL